MNKMYRYFSLETSDSRKNRKCSLGLSRRLVHFIVLLLLAIILLSAPSSAQTNNTNTTQVLTSHCPPSEGGGPPKPCGHSCCTGLIDICADPTNGICCPYGDHVSKGLCCPDHTFNCGGTCCGGTCLNYGILLGGKDWWVCRYTTNAQCQGIGGLKVCKTKTDCPSSKDICTNGCCFKPPPHPGR